jgi:hypothetical protein
MAFRISALDAIFILSRDLENLKDVLPTDVTETSCGNKVLNMFFGFRTLSRLAFDKTIFGLLEFQSIRE